MDGQDYLADAPTIVKIGGREIDLKRLARERCLPLDALRAAALKRNGSA